MRPVGGYLGPPRGGRSGVWTVQEYAANINNVRLDYASLVLQYRVAITGAVISKNSASELQCASNSASLGVGHIFVSMPKKKLENTVLRWRGYYPNTSGAIDVTALLLEGSYDRNTDSDFPSAQLPLAKGSGQYWSQQFTFSDTIFTQAIGTLSGSLEYATFFLSTRDRTASAACTGYFHDLQILNVDGSIRHDFRLSERIVSSEAGSFPRGTLTLP